jgi:type I restriction enzyme R subunit
VAKDLLNTLIAERLVLDWRKKQQTRAAVELTIQKVLEELPPVFNQDQYQQKCGLAYQHIYENYYGEGKSIYARLSASTLED